MAGDSWAANQSPQSLDPWQLSQQGCAELERNRARDGTLFALANGQLGVRGGLEEAGADSGGSFMASVYEQHPIHYHEKLPGFARSTDTRVPVAEATRIQIWLGGECLELSSADCQYFERVLDFRSGVLRRRMQLRTASGQSLLVDAERVLPFTGQAGAGDQPPSLLAIRYRVQSLDYSGPMSLVSMIDGQRQLAGQGDDPRIGVHSVRGLATVAGQADALAASLLQRTHHSGISVACQQRHRVADGLAFDTAVVEAQCVSQRYRGQLQPGQALWLEKLVAYAAARGAQPSGLDEALDAAMPQGFDGMAASQAQSLDRFWARADIDIEGDPRTEQALRFNLFHLLQSAGHDGHTGTAAKGLTGEGYEGHCFWDTEAFVLPVMVFTAPEVARSMLQYRHATLDAARAHAREMNHRSGALYAWRTIAGGECSAHYPSGSAAYHINAAVAYGVGLYWDATGDIDFICQAGAEILFETARIWPQVGHFNPRRNGAFCIHEVTGPDEYTAMVDNNFYTNRMAQQHLRRAVQIWELLQRKAPQAAAELATRLHLDADEVAGWALAAANMYLPHDERHGIVAQDDGFLDKPHWPFPPQPGEHRPLLLDYHPLTLYRYQICKQADAVMALVLAGDDFDGDCKRRSFDYYEAVTTHDSTLSACVFGILAGEVGHADKAWHYFNESLRVDLDDLHRNTGHGVHMAAMAGSWLGLVQGFAGMRVRDGELTFAPSLPAAWPAYAFTLGWRGRRLRLRVEADAAFYTVLDGDALAIHHHGQLVLLKPGRTHRAAHAGDHPPDASGSVFPRRCQAVIFDLDGVLTDTAHTHYQAWKRLADEIGVPFDHQINERLKGVDRMSSLEIILERSQRQYSTAEKQQLAARKNQYYVSAISQFGPDDLFPGVAKLLRDLRQAGIRIGLASASRNAPLLLQRLGIAAAFDHVADPAAVAFPKPAPDIFLAAAQALAVPAEACIGVEDAVAGIQAIKRAGMAAIGIGEPAQLVDADRVLATIADFDIHQLIAF
ncbi:beta-phosphoglucomutase [Pseudoxanthomonas dokdonensis]|uniref:Beta-phosphoglucomutase n=1 Tax=Pseudoxanthomonas dokdonensis TaxID=344882 RepID=A0A0R0CZV6_9GAMM|nr:beta-phosphoglucomutase [Pseudoxanthomonas dokdonensis]KRG71655.1 beta-phosphoglucomutase [Pseudoxanthomonas dokdonensis]